MKKLNNTLNWKGFKPEMIAEIVTRKLKSDYSVRDDKLDCPKSTNKLKEGAYTGEHPPFDDNGIGYAVRKEDIKGKLKEKFCCTEKKSTIIITATESQGRGGKGEPIRYKVEKTADN